MAEARGTWDAEVDFSDDIAHHQRRSLRAAVRCNLSDEIPHTVPSNLWSYAEGHRAGPLLGKELAVGDKKEIRKELKNAKALGARGAV